jgi:hypothetical protein
MGVRNVVRLLTDMLSFQTKTISERCQSVTCENPYMKPDSRGTPCRLRIWAKPSNSAPSFLSTPKMVGRGVLTAPGRAEMMTRSLQASAAR